MQDVLLFIFRLALCIVMLPSAFGKKAPAVCVLSGETIPAEVREKSHSPGKHRATAEGARMVFLG